MNIIQLTPGAAGMFCGGCMRDNSLVAALRRAGHDALLVPLYTPLRTDEPDNSYERIFFGGINVYLQQKSRIFRSTPEWLDRRLDQPGLLNFAASFGVKTRADDVAELMVSMLKGEDGNQAKELAKLTAFLSTQPKPSVICLSNVLLAGMAKSLREYVKAPVVCTLQGEDSYIDSLPEPQRGQSWDLLRQCVRHVDGFIAVSHYYGDVMRRRLEIPAEKLFVVHNGIEVAGFAAAAKAPAYPTIGYLARIGPEKGLRTLAHAYELVAAAGRVPGLRLRVAGGLSPNDQRFVAELQDRFKTAGINDRVEFLPNVSRDEKIAFLQSLSVLSVPATYGESFGLYVIEAMGCGVPVVQPGHAAFPELIEATGGGILSKPDDAADLAAKLEELLRDESRRVALGAAGRKRVVEHFNIDGVAREVVAVFEKFQ
jgi:glycosyltransferase involved in cell wall biosynthesis